MYKFTNALKTIFVLSLVAVFCVGSVLAADYDWASGYKIRSSESMDNINMFQHTPITGGGFQGPAGLVAIWDVNQTNWTFDSVCNQSMGGSPSCGDANAAGATTYDDSYQALYAYMCSGDVNYNLQTSVNTKDLVGGDTMYGAWSMLFSYFPPVLDETNCGQFGRCFVGNAYVLDSKAQNESVAGRMWALGVKDLVEGPGDVFYFDQVRAMTQPPLDTSSAYNSAFLVGDMVTGIVCNDVLALLDAYDSDGGACGICGPNIGSLADRILTAAGLAFNVPAANIWAAMWHEGGDHSEYWGNGHIPSDEEILSWSTQEACGGTPMPGCDNNDPTAQPPYGHLAGWFYLDVGADSIWNAVQQIDPSRDTPDKVSRCNFLDATFAAAKALHQGSSMYAGTTCDSYAFTDAVRPGNCSWSSTKVAQSQRAYAGSCDYPGAGPAYNLINIVANFNNYKCY